MKTDDNNEHENNPWRPIILPAALILLAVFASLWTIIRAFREPSANDAAIPQTAAPATIQPLPASPPEKAVAVTAPSMATGGEFATDFETIRKLEEVARETAENLRRQAQENPETAMPEEQIKAIERGDLAIQ